MSDSPWNRRFMAWLVWLGLQPTEEAGEWALDTYKSFSYSRWIRRRMADAIDNDAGVTDRGEDARIIDHDRFTAFCENYARDNAA